MLLIIVYHKLVIRVSEAEPLTSTQRAGTAVTVRQAQEGIVQISVTVTEGTGAYVPASIGGEPIWQAPVSTVYVGTAPHVVITGIRSELVLSKGTVDVSPDVPAAIADDHAVIVAWWSAEVERQEADAETIRLEAARDRGSPASGSEGESGGRAAVPRCEGRAGLRQQRQPSRHGALRHRRLLRLHGLCLTWPLQAPQRLADSLGMGCDDTTLEPDPISTTGPNYKQVAA